MAREDWRQGRGGPDRSHNTRSAVPDECQRTYNTARLNRCDRNRTYHVRPLPASVPGPIRPRRCAALTPAEAALEYVPVEHNGVEVPQRVHDGQPQVGPAHHNHPADRPPAADRQGKRHGGGERTETAGGPARAGGRPRPQQGGCRSCLNKVGSGAVVPAE